MIVTNKIKYGSLAETLGAMLQFLSYLRLTRVEQVTLEKFEKEMNCDFKKKRDKVT